MNVQDEGQDVFTIERHGGITVIVASPTLERMDPTLIEQATEFLLKPLRTDAEPLIVVDLEAVDYFGSIFLAVLIRCWKQATVKGGMMALACVSERAKELLRVTSLDMIWPMYATRVEAVDALLSD